MKGDFIAAGGTRLHLDRAGEGRPVVFQHGLCGDSGQTAQVFPDGAGFRRLTLECRGHGRSEAGPPERFSFADFAGDLAAMIAAEGQGAPVIGGISMGAALALRLAVTEPELTSALILARPAWGAGPAPATMAPNALVGDLLTRFPAAEAEAQFEASPTAGMLSAEAPDNLASLRGFFRREPASVTAALLSRLAADDPSVSAAELAALRLPVLVIGHGRDHVHPLCLAQSLAAAIPGAKLVEITPKATDPARYRSDFRAAMADFLLAL